MAEAAFVIGLFLICMLALPIAMGVVWLARILTKKQRPLRELFLNIAYWGAIFAAYAAIYRWYDSHP